MEDARSYSEFIWNIAELLRGDFKRSQYGRIILPFTVLRRLECVLEPSRDEVLKEAEQAKELPTAIKEKKHLQAGRPALR